MQSILKDFLDRLTPSPPETFWRFPSNPEALVAEMEVARTGLGVNLNNNNNSSNAASTAATNPQPQSSAAKFTGSHVFIQIQGALRHGGRPSLAAFESLKGIEKCMQIASSPISGAATSTTAQKQHASSATVAAPVAHGLEALAAGASADLLLDDDINHNVSSGQQQQEQQSQSGNNTTCTCQVSDPGICAFCHESLRQTAWRLYALTTVLFAFREICACLVSSGGSGSLSSAASSSASSSSAATLSLPSTYSIAQCCTLARELSTRVFLLIRKLHTRWTHQKMRKQSARKQAQLQRRAQKQKQKQKQIVQSQPPPGMPNQPTASTDDRQHQQQQQQNNNTDDSGNYQSDEDKEEGEDGDYDVDEGLDPVARVLKFSAATFLQHTTQVALDVLAMLATGFETPSSVRFAQPHMDRLSVNNNSNNQSQQLEEKERLKEQRRRLSEGIARLRDVAVVSLAQSLLLTRESLLAAFLFSRTCHDIIVSYEEALSRAAGAGAGDSDDDDVDHHRRSSFFSSSSSNTLISERHERALVNIELSAVKLTRAVLTPPTVFDAAHVDDKGEHPSSYVASELCDEQLETAHVFTGVHRHQIAAGIASRVVALLDPSSAGAYGGGGRKRGRGGESDTDSTATGTHNNNQQFAPSRLATQYAVNAAQLFLHLAVHDLWVSFARLPAQVRKQQRAAVRAANAQMLAVNSPQRVSALSQSNVSSLEKQQQQAAGAAASPTSAIVTPPRARSSGPTTAPPPHLEHGVVYMHPARGCRIQTFLGVLSPAELEPLALWLSELLALPETSSTSAEHHHQPHQQQQATLNGSEKKSILATLLAVDWCLLGNPEDKAQQQQQRLFVPNRHNNNNQNLSPGSPINNNLLNSININKTPSDGWATGGLVSLTTTALAAGLGHFHNLGLSSYCASVARNDEQSLNTNATLAQHRGVLHVPVGSDIFVDSSFMPVVKGQSSTVALEAPPQHPIDPSDYAPGLRPEDQRSTVSAVLGAVLLAAPRRQLLAVSSEEENQAAGNNINNNHKFSRTTSSSNAGGNDNNNHKAAAAMKLPDPASITGMASLCTTTLIAVAAPKRGVARIPFSSVRIGSLHKNTANALNGKYNANGHFVPPASTGGAGVAAADAALAELTAAEKEENENSSCYFVADSSVAAFDPHNTQGGGGSNREMLLDLNRTLVLLNSARQISNVQLGIRSEIAGIAPTAAFSNAVADKPFLAAGFIFSTASEGVRRTLLKPEWYRATQFAAEHQAQTKTLLLGPPTQQEKLEQLQQQQGGLQTHLVASPTAAARQASAPVTLAEKRKQRWAAEAAVHARKAAVSERRRRRRLLAAANASNNEDEAATGATPPNSIQDKHEQALAAIHEADDRAQAAEAIIRSGEAPEYCSPQKALGEAQAVAARKAEQLEQELERVNKEKEEALALVASLRNQADVVATCVIPPLQSEVKLLRHLLGQTLGALRAAERVAEKQNERMQEFERRLMSMAPQQQQQHQQHNNASAVSPTTSSVGGSVVVSPGL